MRTSTPPYEAWSALAQDIPHEAWGRVIHIDLDLPCGRNLGARLAQATTAARNLRHRLRAAVLAAHVGDSAHAVDVFEHLRGAGVRLWLPGHLGASPIREAAERSGLHERDVSVWLGSVLKPRGPTEWGVLHHLARIASGATLDSQVLPDVGRWSKRMGLPPVRRWMALGRLLPAIVELRARTRLTVAGASDRHGYPEASALSNACKRILGLYPTELRKWIGWESLLVRFLGRFGPLTPFQPGQDDARATWRSSHVIAPHGESVLFKRWRA